MDDATILQLQQALVDLMKKNGSLKTVPVERAFLTVPRHFFLPGEPVERTYTDIAIAVRKTSENQWTSSSSQPTMMAIMLEQLDLRPGMKVLEIGTGTGFNAALMAEIVGPQGRVVTVDIQPDLVEQARERLDASGYTRVQTVAGDGGFGFAEDAPYDRVILTVGSEVIAPAWREQLAEGGKLVLPLTIGRTQKSIAFERREDELASASISDCGFMMLQGAFAAESPIRTQVGLDADLFIISNRPLPVEGEKVAQWLAASASDLTSGVETSEHEVWSGLSTWLTIQQPDWGMLIAEGDQARKNDQPALLYVGTGAEFRTKQCFILAAPEGAALITRPADNPALFRDFNSPCDEEDQQPQPPFELCVRQVGPDPSSASRLVSIIRTWQEMGKPGSEAMRIRAIPAEMDYRPGTGEYLVEKPWTKLVISYQ